MFEIIHCLIWMILAAGCGYLTHHKLYGIAIFWAFLTMFSLLTYVNTYYPELPIRFSV